MTELEDGDHSGFNTLWSLSGSWPGLIHLLFCSPFFHSAPSWKHSIATCLNSWYNRTEQFTPFEKDCSWLTGAFVDKMTAFHSSDHFENCLGCNTVGFISKHISHAAVEVNRDHQVGGIVSLWWFLRKKKWYWILWLSFHTLNVIDETG